MTEGKTGVLRALRPWRIALTSAITIVSFAVATAAVGVLRLDDALPAPLPQKVENLLPQYHGGPLTFLVLGSDRRAVDADDGYRGLSDTTILLRIDPDTDKISVLNIPRDLKVDIPGYGVDKFNAAYSFGGPKLTLQTIKELTRGTGLQINHVVNVDFLGFAQAINSINCVYVDVDRRYYHSNAGLPVSEQYSEINIQPGYQRLCGADGLAYVRYRHTDTDLVRAARQQDFLRDARQRVPTSELVKEVTGVDDSLIKAFTEHTQSDVQKPSQLIDIIKAVIGARGAKIDQVPFPATLGYSYVYAKRTALRAAIDRFLGFPPASASASGATAGASGSTAGPAPGGETTAPAEPTGDTEDDTGSSSDEADLVDDDLGLEHAKTAHRKAPAFPIYYPTKIPSDADYDDDEEISSNPWVYHLNDTSGTTHEAYRIVMGRPAPYDTVSYFGVQGIRGWSDPPILRSPAASKKIGDLHCDLFSDGGHLTLISWHDGGNTYWLSNDLLGRLTNRQMIGMVSSMRVLDARPKKGGRSDRP